MARPVPIGEYQSQVPVEEGLRRIIPQKTGVSIGPALEDVGNAAQAYQAQIQRTDAAAYVGPAMARLRVAAEQHLITNSQKPQDQIDKAGGFMPSVMEDFQGSAADELKGAPNPLAKRMLQQGSATIGVELSGRAFQEDAKRRVYQRATGALDAATHVATAVELNPDSWSAAGAEQLASIRALHLDPETTTKLSREVDKTISEAAARGFAKQDPKGTLGRLNDPQDPLFSGLNLEQRNATQAYAKQQFIEQRAQGIQAVYEDQGTTAGAKALAGIDKDDSVPPDMRDGIRDQVNRQVDAYRSQRREQFAPQIAQLETNIASENAGQADKAQAWNLYEKGALNPTQFASTMEGITRSEQESVKKGLSLEAARQAYSAGTPLDPDRADVKHGVGLLFASLTANSQPGSPDYVNRATDLTAKLGVAPEPAISWARTNIMGGDPKSAASAADLIDRLDTANPRAVPFALDAKTKAIASTINEAVSSGTDPTIAVDMARKNAAEADNKTLDEKWTQVVGGGEKGAASQSGALTSLLKSDDRFKPGWFTGVPQVPTAMQSEFDALTKDYFRYTGGDVKQARTLAANDLKHVWGVSEVNGQREIMAYPPEGMFPGLTPQDIRNDITSTVQREGALKGLDPAGIRLTMDPQRTARTQGSQWNLSAPDKNGLIDVLRDQTGNPLVYQLPVTHEDYGAVRDRVAAQYIEQARQVQQRRKDAEEMYRETSGHVPDEERDAALWAAH